MDDLCSLQDIGYQFDHDGQLRSISDGSSYSPDPTLTGDLRFAEEARLYSAVHRYLQAIMTDDMGYSRVRLPPDAAPDTRAT